EGERRWTLVPGINFRAISHPLRTRQLAVPVAPNHNSVGAVGRGDEHEPATRGVPVELRITANPEEPIGTYLLHVWVTIVPSAVPHQNAGAVAGACVVREEVIL